MSQGPFTAHKILWHRDKVQLALRRQPTKAPISLEWDLSNTCPHDCPFCSFGTSESHGYRQQHWQMFPFERAVDLIPEMAKAGVDAITFTGGGEPLMHPKAARIMELTSDVAIPWGLVTNGYLLKGDVADRVLSDARFVRVSLDAASGPTHQAMHRPKGEQWETILANIADVARRRPQTLTIGASFCVTDLNWQEIGLCAAQLKGLGAQYLEVRPTYPTTWRGDGWGLGLSNISQAKIALEDAKREFNGPGFQVVGLIDRFAALEHPDKDYRRCQIGPLTTVLGADGRLWHCCVQRGMDGFALGSVMDGDFADVWARAQAQHMADQIDVQKCPRCRYDNYNRILEGMETDQLHASFI